MGITDAEKKAIDEAVEELHFVETNEHGDKFIRIYADYRDTNEGLLDDCYNNRKLGFESKDNPKFALIDSLREEIDEWYNDSTWDQEDEIIRRAGFDPSDDKAAEQLEYLRDTYPFVPDYDHFLNQTMKVNIMLGWGEELNRDFGSIREQYEAMIDDEVAPDLREADLSQVTGLSWLVNQQGHTMDELAKMLPEYFAFFDDKDKRHMSYDDKYEAFCATHNRFLSSVCQELVNMVNYMNTMTVLTSISMNDFAALMQPGKEIVLPKNSMIGIFNPWNGGGSTLDIELEKDLVIPSEYFYDVQIEGVKLNYQYSVDNVYGLVGSAWRDAKQVRDAQTAKDRHVSSLADQIASAENRASAVAERLVNTRGNNMKQINESGIEH